MSGTPPDIYTNASKNTIIYSAIGKHLEERGLSKADLDEKQFSVLKKCRSKFFETLFIRELNPELNTRDDSICTKLY